MIQPVLQVFERFGITSKVRSAAFNLKEIALDTVV
jgi:hypothetical protein